MWCAFSLQSVFKCPQLLESVRYIVHTETLLHKMSHEETTWLSSPVLPWGKQTTWKWAETTMWGAFVRTSHYGPCQAMMCSHRRLLDMIASSGSSNIFIFYIQRHVSALCLGIDGQILMWIRDTSLKWEAQEKKSFKEQTLGKGSYRLRASP